MARLEKLDKIKRGEIWVVDLRSAVGWEVVKKRPALIISANQINSIAPVVIILPISSQVPKILGPERVLVTERETGLEKNSVIMVTQIRAIDKTRLIKKVGNLRRDKLFEVEESIRLILGMIELDN